MARENRRDFALDRLQLVIGVGAGQIEENARHPVEAAAAALQRLDRVGESRRLGIGGDGVDLRARLGERRVERGSEMTRLEAVERRRLEWRGPRFEKRVRVGLANGSSEALAAHAPQLGGRAAMRNPGARCRNALLDRIVTALLSFPRKRRSELAGSSLPGCPPSRASSKSAVC